MGWKDTFESKRSVLSGHQNTTTTSSSNNRQPCKKPPLPARGTSTAPSKVPSLKKPNELKRGSGRSLNLPVLNLEKVRRNVVDQAELSSYEGLNLGSDSPQVHSARFPTEKHRIERNLISGPLTERDSRDAQTERRISTSFNDKSCRQNCDRKNMLSGSFTDRSYRESFGSSYALTLNNYLRSSRESPLRNSKESPFSTPSTLRVKAGDRVAPAPHLVHQENRKPKAETAKYHPSPSLSNYLSSANQLNSSFCNWNSRADSLSGSSKHSTAVAKGLLSSRDSSDSKGSELKPLPLSLESSRSNTFKTDLGSWDSKRLPLQLVNTLEEALAGVNQSGFLSMETKTFTQHGSLSRDATLERNSGKLRAVKPITQMAKSKVPDVQRNQEEALINGIATNRRGHPRTADNCFGESISSNKDVFSRLQSKSYKVNPLKLSLGNSQIAASIGHRRSPAESIPTCRPTQTFDDDGISRRAYTDRGLRRKSYTNFTTKHEKTSGSNVCSSSDICMTPETALEEYRNRLTSYEHNEIKEYPEIYFVGADCQKLQPSNSPGAYNYGYDDERGDYTIIEHDHIAYRFEILGMLGKGSFGQVVKCQDHKYKVLRAIKLVRNKKRFHQQAQIEVRILHHLRDKFMEGFCRRMKKLLAIML